MSESISKTVAIVDYGMGNLFSVYRACQLANLNAVVTSSAKDIETADGVILPGVGAFGDAMEILGQLDLISPLRKTVASNKPLLGVCLGMQLLMDKSFEFGEHKGLGFIAGEVRHFGKPYMDGRQLKVPQVGWNQIYPASQKRWDDSPLSSLSSGVYMYFVHSYYVIPKDKEVILSLTRYGDVEFCSSLSMGNIFACQFHPERSALQGLEIYKNFARLIGANLNEQ